MLQINFWETNLKARTPEGTRRGGGVGGRNSPRKSVHKILNTETRIKKKIHFDMKKKSGKYSLVSRTGSDIKLR